MQTTGTAPRSVFVTNLAWTLMALGALSTVNAAVHGAMLLVSESVPWLREDPPTDEDVLLAIYLFFGLYVVASAALGGIGWGLLHRRRWARRILLVVLWTTIAGYAAFLLAMLGVVVISLAAFGGQGGAIVATIGFVIAVPVAILGGAVAAFFWWIARRLAAPPARAEFALA